MIMKKNQGFWKGTITIEVEGLRCEDFLNRCLQENIPLWDVQRIDSKKCKARVYVSSIKRIKRIRKQANVKLRINERFGLPFILSYLQFKKPLIIGLVLSFFVIFLLSNLIWQVKIVGVSPEIEYKLKQELDAYGLKSGKFKFSIGNIDDIERNITNNMKDVMWIGIEEKGTTYIVQGVEKSIADIEENDKPQHLVASKEGEIIQMLVENGQPVVRVDQHVEKGDILVSGIIGQETNEEDDEEKEQLETQLVRSYGKVYARTWYTTETVVPLTYEHETLTGKNDQQYKLKIGKLKIPIWDFFAPDYTEKREELNVKPLYFLNFKLPLSVEKKTIHESERIEGERTEKEAVEEGIAQAKRELKKHIGYDGEILDIKILQQTKENDKVKVNLYFVVKENIAKPQPINQGD